MRHITRPALAAAFALAVGLGAASPLLAYNVKLKDGSIIFARTKYEVKGKKAIITLENGTVVSYDLDMIDIPGTDKYNKENPGNVLVIDTAPERQNVTVVTPGNVMTLQDVIKRRKMKLEAPSSRSSEVNAATAAQQVEAAVEQAFRKVFDGAGITQYRLTDSHGKVRFLATANTEESVFNTLSAVARALADLGGRGQDLTVEIVLTSSSGESGGNFMMTSDQARLLVNGNISIADYFLKNVIL